jgi:hypothetical protein
MTVVPPTTDIDHLDPEVLSVPVPAIYTAMQNVMLELGTFAKNGVGPSTQNSYPFLKVDDIVARLTPALIKCGVVTESHITDVVQDMTRFPKVTPSGDVVHDGRPTAVQLITRLRYEVSFISTLDGSRMTSNSYGESQDTGDKGIRRAATAAYKEILLRTFSIVSGEDDPDAFDPNAEPPVTVRNDRGAQQMEKAAQPRVPRAKRAGATKQEETASAAPEAAPAVPETAPEAVTQAQPTEEARPAAAAPKRETAPAQPEPAAPAEQPAAAAAPVRETQTPAEQRGADWKVDPADVAHAEADLAQRSGQVDANVAAAAAAPPAREVQQLPEPAKTQADTRFENIGEARAAIMEAYKARGMSRDEVNLLGDQVAQKPRAKWFASLPDLRKVLKAIENGEVADEVKGEF